MAKQSKIGRNKKKCERYLIEKRRIKNKTKQLEAKIRYLNPKSQEKIRQHCKISRKKELRGNN